MKSFSKALQTVSAQAFIIVAILTLTFVATLAQTDRAAAYTISTCHAWQYSAHTMSRDCSTTTSGVIAIQYSDYGSPDGLCVRPAQFRDYGGSGWMYDARMSYSGVAPWDCTTSGVTTVYTSSPKADHSTGNIVAYIGSNSNPWVSYNTTCMSNPANPSFVSLRPYCF